MDALANPILAYYVAVMVILSVYGLHRYALVLTYLRHCRGTTPEPPGEFRQLPTVTVQLPMFNERRVAERVIEAACRLDYPVDLLQIQVLDDSTDESAVVARQCCRRLASEGHNVQLVHREDRGGFKAGALDHGLDSATGEFIAIFDADFVPPADFLRRTIHHFTDGEVGMVQARWSHLNRDASLLTRIQAISLDAHFVVEQAARAAAGHWFNFNGTAGVWRRRCIDEAGGWQHETLTEDTDLSYRAQMAGWRFRFLPSVSCPAEIPPTLNALISQQHRWNKGLMQTAIKLMPDILRSRASLRTKLEAWFHLTSSVPYVAILVLALLSLPAMFVAIPVEGISATIALGFGFACLGFGTLAATVYYVVSQWGQGRSVTRALLHVPALMAIGIGVSIVNTKAAAEALYGRRSPFVRTPKFAGERVERPDPTPDPAAPEARRRRRSLPAGSLEVALGLALIGAVVLAFNHWFTLIGVPFLLLFASGFLGVGLPVLRRSLEARFESLKNWRLGSAKA